MTDYESTDKSSVCSTPLPPPEKLDGVIINEPSSAPAKGNKSASSSKVNSAPTGSFLLEEESSQETLRMSKKVVKHVVAQFTPQLITMTLSDSEECDIKKPIWYPDSGCSRHMTGVKSYLHKYVEQP
ncbi:hypothetical protein Tco_0424379 [Tanacetum coccineum]